MRQSILSREVTHRIDPSGLLIAVMDLSRAEDLFEFLVKYFKPSTDEVAWFDAEKGRLVALCVLNDVACVEFES